MENERQQRFVTVEVEKSMRLDLYLSEVLQLMTRSQLKVQGLWVRLLADQQRYLKLSSTVHLGDQLLIEFIPPQTGSDETLEPYKRELNILYEDDDCIVVDKDPGLVVHPGLSHFHDTLVNALLYYSQVFSKNFPQSMRPGLVHRLDKETSGVIICAKHVEALEFFAAQFRERRVEKIYGAIIHATALRAPEGEIKTLIHADPQHHRRQMVSVLSESSKGRYAETYWRLIHTWSGSPFAFIELRPHTGRTHQLRVHMRHNRTPIVGDDLYGNDAFTSLMLHAWSLRLELPCGTVRSFTSKTPQRFKELCQSQNLDAEVLEHFSAALGEATIGP